MRGRTVFLDRDGVINRRRDDYVKEWREFELLPGALEAIARLTAAGREVVVITNQSAIGRGLMSEETVSEMHARLSDLADEAGGSIRAFLVCPHTPWDGCECRKPAPGLLHRAHSELGVDLRDSVVVGDQPSDALAAAAAGCPALLVGPEREYASLAEAVDAILA
jgi:D-glycero-D-manno-heptose 1,7-bisphosphate phosphatase